MGCMLPVHELWQSHLLPNSVSPTVAETSNLIVDLERENPIKTLTGPHIHCKEETCSAEGSLMTGNTQPMGILQNYKRRGEEARDPVLSQ